MLIHDAFQQTSRAYGYGAFVYQNHAVFIFAFGQQRGNVMGCFKVVGQVRGAIPVGWRVDAHVEDIGFFHNLADV